MDKSKRKYSRRKFITASVATGAGIILSSSLPLLAKEINNHLVDQNMKRVFTILHTNDIHSNLIGMGPASDYTPFNLNDDNTRGGYSRLASLIKKRREIQNAKGPVILLDAGDYSMGTAFAAGNRETGCELQLMSVMGYDATTFGNHDFDLGPEGLGKSIRVSFSSGRIPSIVASNTSVKGSDPTLTELQNLENENVIRKYIVIERGGIRFGIFGILGKEAQFYTSGAGAVTFTDSIETAKEMVKALRETEKADIVICLSHGGLVKDKDGKYSDGDDLKIARDVPGIDIVIGGHSHTELHDAIMINDHTPVVQTGVAGKNLGELVISVDSGKMNVDSYILHPIDDTIAGDKDISGEIETFKKSVTAAVFASRGYSIDQPLAICPQDLPNTFTDIAAGTILANLCTDSYRKATNADIGFTTNGMMRSGLLKGKTGVQTVYDVFCVAPLGAGVIDETAGSALVTAYFTGRELKNILEFFIIDNPAHPGEYFPRTSGMRFHFSGSREKFDMITSIEIGNYDEGYKSIDISGSDERLYSLTCPLYVGLVLISIPKYTNDKLSLKPKNKDGKILTSKIESLEMPRENSGFMLPPPGKMDKSSLATSTGEGNIKEIKEWQAIMDFLRGLPSEKGELPVIPVDERAAEVRAINED